MERRAPTLLVIEDALDQAILVGVAARRAHPGLDVRNATNGLEGIAYFAGTAPFEDPESRPRPDLVILDLVMPQVDGFEVLEWMRERSELATVPVVVLTSSPKPDDEARALELGAVSVHRKPTNLDALGDVVKEIVQRWIKMSEMIGAHIWAAG